MQPVILNDTFCAGDRIRVGDKSRADIVLANRAVLRLGQNTTITLGGFQKEPTVLVHLIEGPTDYFRRVTRVLEFPIAFINAGVEGTKTFMQIGNNQTEITLLDGKVAFAIDA